MRRGEPDALERQIEATDREIDRLVYGLYGLIPPVGGKDIRIVGQAAAHGVRPPHSPRLRSSALICVHLRFLSVLPSGLSLTAEGSANSAVEIPLPGS